MITTLLLTIAGVIIAFFTAAFLIICVAMIWNGINWLFRALMDRLPDSIRTGVDKFAHLFSLVFFAVSIIGLFLVYGLFAHHIFYCHHHLSLR